MKAYPRETTEAFLDGHVSAFGFFGGVPRSILYDNLKLAVARICGDGTRERTRAFTGLVSHYLFQDRFGRPGRGNGKGKVEGLVKFVRSDFLTPLREHVRRGNATSQCCCRAIAWPGLTAPHHHWPGFTPPRWPAFTPPLTSLASAGIYESQLG